MLTSVPTTAAAEDDKLEMLRINIKHWRTDKGLSYRFMPVHLWDEAIILARLLGERRVSCVTGLNLEELKRRMQGRQVLGGHTTVTAQPDPSAPQFIELPGVAVTPPGAPAAVDRKVDTECNPSVSREASAECTPDADRTVCATPEAVVEITAANGDRLTVRVPVATLNISSLIHDFRQSRP